MFIKVRLHPGSKKDKVEEVKSDKLEIWVKEKAEQNKANLKMLDLVAEKFVCSVKRIRIISGHHRPSKMLEIIEKND